MTTLLLLLLAECAPGSTKPVAGDPVLTSAPADARPLLRAIHRVTKLEDLRPLMATEFIWSFGGDALPDQALAEWAKDPAFLKTLRTALTGTCKREQATLTCKGKKGPRLVFGEGRDVPPLE